MTDDLVMDATPGAPAAPPEAAATPFEPVILAFTCNWCSYRAADLAGTARMKYPPNVRLVRLMCSGRLDPTFVLKAFASGADGVLMTGCWPADCHYRIQNVKALRRFQLLHRVLEQLGIEPARFQRFYASAAEGSQLAAAFTRMVEEVRPLGPLGWGGGPDLVADAAVAADAADEAAAGEPDEAILDFAEHFDIVFWPAIMDAKYADVEAMPDGSIDLTLFSGGIRNTENAAIARLLRRKSACLVAFGSCANEGCIPGLANLTTTRALLDTVYEGPTIDNPDHIRPGSSTTVAEGELHLPAMEALLGTLDQVVEVDYRVPGCPPETERIADVLGLLVAALDGKATLPPRGSVLGAGQSTVCDECRRDRGIKHIAEFTRLHERPPLDPGLCLLEQGIPCNGPATRSGCVARCPLAGAPCIGCYGPADGVVDFGARLLSAFASVVDADEAAEIDRILDGLPDPVGQFYRFSLAGSLLRGSRAVRTGPARPAAVAPESTRELATSGAHR